MSGTTTTTRTVGALPAVTTLPAGSEVVALVADATVSGGKAARRAPATAFQGPAGAQGTPGTAGTAGATGPAGASMRSGTGAPPASLGANGDSYVDGATGNVYTKSGGAWTQTAGASLRGPAGPAGSGTGGTAFDPATLPAATALAATDEGVVVQGGASKRATLAAMATAAGISLNALPVAGALAGANEVTLNQGGNATRLTLDALVTYMQGRLGTATPAPTWTLRADYAPSGGLTAYGAVGNGWTDPGQSWRVTAANRLESNSTWLDPWANNHLARTGEVASVNQRVQARFTAATGCIFHLLARVTGSGAALDGLACSVQPEGWFRVDPIAAGARGDLAGADGTVTLTPGTSYDLRADVVQSGSTTNVAMTLFAVSSATAALCSGTQLSTGTVAYTGTTAQNTAGGAGMFWYAETENTPTFVDRFAWYAA